MSQGTASAGGGVRGVPSEKRVGQHSSLVLLVVSTAILLDALDLSITQVALPDIRRSLDLSTSGVQWTVNAYVLTYAGFLLFGGRAADLLGARRVLLFGLAVFGVMSLVAGLSPNAVVVILARAIQGVGAALTVPSSVAIIAGTFAEGRERNRAFGVFSAAAASGFSAGLILGGVLTDLLNWRWIFFVKVPIVAATLIIGVRVIPRAETHDRSRSYDLLGGVLCTAGLLLIAFAVTQIAGHTVPVPLVIASAVAAVVLLIAFVVNEAKHPDPLLPLRIFRMPTLRNADISSLAVLAAPFGYSYVVTLYTQEVLHYSPLKTGLALLPAAVVSALVSRYMAPALIRRYGMRITGSLAGLFLVALGFLMLALVDVDTGYATVLLPSSIICLGLGVGNAYPTYAIGGVTGVGISQQGLAAGIQQTALQVGGGLGLALVATGVSASLDGKADPNDYIPALHVGAFVGTVIPLLGAIVTLLGRMDAPEAVAEEQEQAATA
ncbi:MFS transporter [Microbispora catharanthi]|uniref:MFS transporter n=1 Tax=Microbispora catharanthi TaxID=1712871 RepID=A0A5N6C148_9ACTN|nr:MFS transporter [Microbispora catharanthi]KAB8186484.1 MFS transporter [Microbispora catharanthi]